MTSKRKSAVTKEQTGLNIPKTRLEASVKKKIKPKCNTDFINQQQTTLQQITSNRNAVIFMLTT